MPGKAFMDTNILIYATTKADPGKKKIARDLLLKPSCVTSTQVLLESSNVLIRKLGARPLDVFHLLRNLQNVQTVSHTREIVEEAWRISDRYGYSIYDSAIISAAVSANCDHLYSEDLQHGQKIGNLRILNPFQ
jgi:predicted nucleic acid-binding protein